MDPGACHDWKWRVVAFSSFPPSHPTPLSNRATAGQVKDQLDKLMDRFFSSLPTTEDMIDFSTSVVAMRVQKRWHARTRMLKLKRRQVGA
jgi:hypothetical protein